jgi:hypothetical protein
MYVDVCVQAISIFNDVEHLTVEGSRCSSFADTHSSQLHILGLSVRGASSTRYLGSIQRNRATIQIVIHIISAGLGGLQVYVLGSLVRFRTNIRLLLKPTTLDKLKLHGALNFGKLDWDLPLWPLAVVVAYVAGIQVPAAIWAGAITPVIISQDTGGNYRVPYYDLAHHETWDTPCRPATGCGENVISITTEQGTFTRIGWTCKAHFWCLVSSTDSELRQISQGFFSTPYKKRQVGTSPHHHSKIWTNSRIFFPWPFLWRWFRCWFA